MPNTLFSEHAIDTGITSHDRKEWLLARRKVVTASGTAALLGLHPYLDPIDIYAEMLSTEPINDVDHGLDSPLTWGLALEEAIAKTAAKHYGWNLEMSGRLLLSKANPNIGATLDAEFIDGQGVACVYEGKSWSAMRSKDWDEETGKAPDYIAIQAQTQLIVTGAPVNHVCCLIGGAKWSHIIFEPFPELKDMILKAVDDFMGHITRLEPPPVTYRSQDAIRTLYPQDNGEVITLPAEAMEWAAEANNLAEQIKLMTEQREELRNRIRMSIGEATYGVLPLTLGMDDINGPIGFKYSHQHKNAYMVSESNSRPLISVKKIPGVNDFKKKKPRY